MSTKNGRLVFSFFKCSTMFVAQFQFKQLFEYISFDGQSFIYCGIIFSELFQRSLLLVFKFSNYIILSWCKFLRVKADDVCGYALWKIMPIEFFFFKSVKLRPNNALWFFLFIFLLLRLIWVQFNALWVFYTVRYEGTSTCFETNF